MNVNGDNLNDVEVPPILSIVPIEDRVVVEQIDAEVKVGSIYIPDNAQEKPNCGIVIAAGKGRWYNGVFVEMDIRIGDKVVYPKYSGTPYTLDGKEIVVIRSSDVLFIER